MQQPMQMQPGLRDPRQRYGLGSFVKKAIRGVKKIAKSPLGKAAIIGGLGMIPFGTAGVGGSGLSTWGRLGAMMKGAGGASAATGSWQGGRERFLGKTSGGLSGFASKYLNPFNKSNPLLYTGGALSGKKAFGLGSAFALGAPLLQNMFAKGKDVVEEVDEDYIDPYTAMMMAKFKNPQMNFLPADRFTDNYYQNVANGGRIGYADGMMVEEEEDIDIGIPTFMKRRGYQGGELVEQESVEEIQLPNEAEQMLQMEYQKYVEGGGQLPYPEFKKLVLQQMKEESRQPEVQETIVAENVQQEDPAQGIAQLAMGGPVPGSQVSGYGLPAGHNAAGYYNGGTRVNAAEGGMMDMGGMEKDYRAEGGFVPIGKKEKADDVPARLSVNEFVFTADAVRNAGGGDIDRGAEVMENMMKNLENGGQISEDSQGAQGMYDQQQMLQSRMA